MPHHVVNGDWKVGTESKKERMERESATEAEREGVTKAEPRAKVKGHTKQGLPQANPRERPPAPHTPQHSTPSSTAVARILLKKGTRAVSHAANCNWKVEMEGVTEAGSKKEKAEAGSKKERMIAKS